MLEALQFDFMRHAIAAGILVSIACGIVGTLVVVNRVVFISGGIAHAAYGGIGIGYFFGINPLVGAIFFTFFSALGMGFLQRRIRERADTLIGVMWAIGMAIGVIFIDLTPGYKADLMSYLFGSILAIIRNIPVEIIYLGLMGITALTIVAVMQVVGLIMVIALLTIPAAISGQFVKNMKAMMVLAIILGIVFTLVGLWLSYSLNLTSGATIILVAGLGYLISLAWKPFILTITRKIANL